MASIKLPKVQRYNFTNAEMNILKRSGSLHPGNPKNMRIFWPLYLQHNVSNVHVFNFTLILDPLSKCKYKFHDKFYSPVSKQYAQANFGKKPTSKRFIYLILVIYEPEGGAHANGLLYDTKTQNLERFEPHGSETVLSYTKITPYEAQKMKEFLEQNLGISIKRFYQPKSVCPRIGWQIREGLPRPFDYFFNKKWGISGYCMAWSMYFILLRAQNPDIRTKQLQEHVFENYETTSDYIHDFYYDFLRWKVKILKV